MLVPLTVKLRNLIALAELIDAPMPERKFAEMSYKVKFPAGTPFAPENLLEALTGSPMFTEPVMALVEPKTKYPT